ncbi:MAG: DUF4399 domain-containing protein [Paracoccaceae bacterium]|jgi:hypothetical protein|nr:DUF4399 domain-containing protein [Paracoccaceae bacterium]
MKPIFAALCLAALPTLAIAQGTPRPAEADLYFVNVDDGDTVAAPVTVVFGLRGMGVAPAGVEIENTGHHHLMINRPPLGEGQFGEGEFTLPLPADENHRHFGGGQTEVTLDLPPGEHVLQLVLADYGHVPHDPPLVSERITITVE